MSKHLSDERLENLIKFVIEDQLILTDNKDNTLYHKEVKALKKRKEAIPAIMDWVQNHMHHIKDDTNNVCNPKYYIMIVDAMAIEIADIEGDIDSGTLAFDFEKQYSKDNWDR